MKIRFLDPRRQNAYSLQTSVTSFGVRDECLVMVGRFHPFAGHEGPWGE